MSTVSPEDYAELADALLGPVLEAGALIMSYFGGSVSVDTKDDNSPVTEADRRAEDILVNALDRLLPDVPAVGEERMSAGASPDVAGELFLIDPLDGTRGFIKGRREFTVNVGYAAEGTARFGIIYAPALGLFYASTGPRSAIRMVLQPDARPGPIASFAPETIETRALDRAKLTAVSSRYISKDLTKRLEGLGAQRIDSNSSIKFCRVAEGAADIYPRYGTISEWDTAAGAAILKAAGGCVTALDGSEALYGKVGRAFENDPFIAWSTPGPPRDLLEALS
ncbi:MAG: inositol monophosphatase family protein [Pseudomonadota bacterium]